MSDYNTFLPISRRDLEERGWYWYDFLVVTGDAYVDHPSFGTAIIARLLEAEGYRVAVLAQPDWHSAGAFAALGRPRLGVLISGGPLHRRPKTPPRRRLFPRESRGPAAGPGGDCLRQPGAGGL